MTDELRVVELVAADAPVAAVMAVADRLAARARDCPGSAAASAAAVLGAAAVRCAGSMRRADVEAVGAAAEGWRLADLVERIARL